MRARLRADQRVDTEWIGGDSDHPDIERWAREAITFTYLHPLRDAASIYDPAATGDLLAARIAGEIGEHITQFDCPNALQCYAGSAPVTRRSGKSDFVVAPRLAHNHYLGAAVHQWAFCSLLRSGWAREFHDSKVTAGKSHHAPLRALSNRWLEILWHCLTKGVLYDEAVHVANRNPAHGHAA